MKILFLFPYPLDQAPSQRFRFEQYFGALLQAGFAIQTQSFWGEYYWKVLYGKGNALQKAYGMLRGFGRRFSILWQVPKYDFVFVHREVTPVGPPFFEWIIAKLLRKKIIFDFDDAIWLPNTSHSNSAAARWKWHSKTASICRWAWKVSAGNNFLATYARQFNLQVVVNPTTIDMQYHHVDEKKQQRAGELVIGWTGSHSTLPYLDALWPVLEKLQTRVPFQFRVISNQPPPVSFPWLVFVLWNKDTEISDLAPFDIGVMPLEDNEWSRGKCGFKALQYMALAIPTVASPVGVNQEIISSGDNGYLCRSDEEWLEVLAALAGDTQLRQRIGEAAKEVVNSRYSVAANTLGFLTLFSG